ncbi:MAG TPA: hypothetical protein VGM33_10565 [Baekduia sp.]
MPYVSCPTCRLASYAVTPHSGRALCPHCDAELFPAAEPLGTPPPTTPGVDGEAHAA